MSSSTSPLAIENPPTASWKKSTCLHIRSYQLLKSYSYLCIRTQNLVVDNALLPLSSYMLPTQMSLKTIIHAFCFAHALLMHTVASERNFCSIHAYILIACSFLEAGKSNIYHFVSQFCLESICSTRDDTPFSVSLTGTCSFTCI